MKILFSLLLLSFFVIFANSTVIYTRFHFTNGASDQYNCNNQSIPLEQCNSLCSTSYSTIITYNGSPSLPRYNITEYNSVTCDQQYYYESFVISCGPGSTIYNGDINVTCSGLTEIADFDSFYFKTDVCDGTVKLNECKKICGDAYLKAVREENTYNGYTAVIYSDSSCTGKAIDSSDYICLTDDAQAPVFHNPSYVVCHEDTGSSSASSSSSNDENSSSTTNYSMLLVLSTILLKLLLF